MYYNDIELDRYLDVSVIVRGFLRAIFVLLTVRRCVWRILSRQSLGIDDVAGGAQATPRLPGESVRWCCSSINC